MWPNQLITMLRCYINDLGDPPTYSDARLTEMLIVAAMQVYQEVNLYMTYDINFIDQTITPDPTTGDGRNDAFCLLMAYKAAALITGSEFKSASAGIMVTDGGSTVDLRQVASSKKAIADFYKSWYDDLKFEYGIGSIVQKAIVGPAATNYYAGYYGNYEGYRY